MSKRNRSLGLIVAVSACAGLVLQFIDTAADNPALSSPEVVWRMARYFTILTNALVAGTFVWAVSSGQGPRAAWAGGLALWMTIVALVYHILLGRDLTGFALLADHMVHTVTPALMVLYWLIAAPKTGLRVKTAVSWLAWPLLYVGYAITRAQFDGVYPYFFVDPTRGGWMHVVQWSAALCGAFFVGGLIFLAVARVVR